MFKVYMVVCAGGSMIMEYDGVMIQNTVNAITATTPMTMSILGISSLIVVLPVFMALECVYFH